MPTFHEETLQQRYERERRDHLARLATLTPEQIAEMEMKLHNASAQCDQMMKALMLLSAMKLGMVADSIVDKAITAAKGGAA